MKLPSVALFLFFLTASLFGCSATPEEAASPEATPSPAAAPSDEATGMAYPALYRSLDLPELPGGELVSAGRQTTSLRDGLTLRITTSMPVAEVRNHYSTALAELGWEEAPSRVIPGAPMAGLQATRDGVRFTATITAMGDETQINLTVVEE